MIIILVSCSFLGCGSNGDRTSFTAVLWSNVRSFVTGNAVAISPQKCNLHSLWWLSTICYGVSNAELFGSSITRYTVFIFSLWFTHPVSLLTINSTCFFPFTCSPNFLLELLRFIFCVLLDIWLTLWWQSISIACTHALCSCVLVPRVEEISNSCSLPSK